MFPDPARLRLQFVQVILVFVDRAGVRNQLTATSTTASTPGQESVSGAGWEDDRRRDGNRDTRSRRIPERLAGSDVRGCSEVP